MNSDDTYKLLSSTKPLVNRKRFKKQLFVMLCIFVANVEAAEIQWDASEGTSRWPDASGGGGSTGTNWSPNVLPGSGDSVFFGTLANSSYLNIDISQFGAPATRNVQSVKFQRADGNSYVIDSTVNTNTLSLSLGKVTVVDGDHTINSAIILGSPASQIKEWWIPSGSLTVNGSMSGTGNIRKSGAGSLMINGSCSFSNLYTEQGTVTLVPQALANCGLILQGGTTSFTPGSAVVNIKSVAGGSALTLGSHPLVIGSGGIPSDDETGTISFDNSVTLNGTYTCNLDGADHDKIEVTGNLNLTNASLTVDDSGGSFGTWTIATFTTLTGQFDISSLPSGYSVVYQANSIVLMRTNAVLVDAGASGDNNGTSWGDAFTSLQSALIQAQNLRDNAANYSGEIWVKAGVYYPDDNSGDRSATFSLPSDITVLGGFVGTETETSERDYVSNLTVLSGDLQENDRNRVSGVTLKADDILGDNSYTVVEVSFTNGSIDGFTITGGKSNGSISANNGVAARGGAVFVDTNTTATPTIKNCRLIGNQANQGGAIFSHSYGSLNLIACDFRGNQATGRGGAAYLWRSFVVTRSCHFSGNHAVDDGGAIYDDPLDFGQSIYSNCTFTGNRADDNGGAIAVSISGSNPNTSTVANTLMWNNLSVNTAGVANNSVTSITAYTISYSLLENIDLSSTGTGNFDGTDDNNDPLFLNPIVPTTAPNSDGLFLFELDSPVVDAGSQSLAVGSTDVLGNERVSGGEVDLGAYEQLTVSVTNTNDDGAGSFRVAVIEAGSGGRIVFDSSLSGQTISLVAMVRIPSHLVIDAASLAEKVIIDAGGNDQVLVIDDGVWEVPSYVFLRGMTFTGGLGSPVGGAIYNEEETTVVDCCFIQNSANGGGAIYSTSSGGSLTVITCSFLGNKATAGGGAVGVRHHGVFTNSIFVGNTTDGDGAAIFSSNGGVNALPTHMINCSMVANVAQDEGGAYYHFLGGTVIFDNCILWSNSSESIAGNITVLQKNNSLIQEDSPTTPPLFVISPDSGDGDWATYSDNNYGDLRLTSNSPAINAGDASSGSSVNTTSTDILGNPRFVETIDQGAYEGSVVLYFGFLYPTLNKEDDANGNGISNYGDYAAGLDPTAPHDLSATPNMNGNQITFSHRNNAVDVIYGYYKSTTLASDSWFRMTSNVDYTVNSSVIKGDQTQVTFELIYDPALTPKLFYRMQYDQSP